MKGDLNTIGVGDIIASEGNWELRHTDRTINEHLQHSAVMLHQCPDDPDYYQWGTPKLGRTLTCEYCATPAPTKLVDQWFDTTKEEE